jgi:hypothetical protein
MATSKSWDEVNLELAQHAERTYFTDDQLIAIEDYCSHAPAGKYRDMVVSIMEFLNQKKYISARQKSAVLGIVNGRQQNKV